MLTLVLCELCYCKFVLFELSFNGQVNNITVMSNHPLSERRKGQDFTGICGLNHHTLGKVFECRQSVLLMLHVFHNSWMVYRKNPKNSDTQNIAVVILKFEQLSLTIEKYVKKIEDETAKSVDLDQTAPRRSILIWVYTVSLDLSVP